MKANLVVPTVLISILFLALPVRAEVDVWVMESLHITLGKAHIYLSDKGLKMDNERLGGVLIARPPDWKVAMFSSPSHQYYVQDLETYSHQKYTGLLFSMINPNREKPVKTGEQETVAGVLTDKYVGYTMSTEASMRPNLRRKDKNKIEYWIATKLVPKATADAYNSCSGFPKMPGVILRIRYEGKQEFQTFTLVKRQYPDSIFQYPSGFKQTKDMQRVLFNDDSIKDVLGP
jgi:hypothetical protein